MEGGEASGGVAGMGFFYLYDVGAVVGEEPGAVGASDVVGEVEYLEVLEELVHGWVGDGGNVSERREGCPLGEETCAG